MYNSEIVFKGNYVWINGKRFHKFPFNGKEDIFEMVEDYNNGFSIKRIVKKYQTNKTRFQQIRRALGIKLSRGGCQLRGSKLEARKKFVLDVLEDIKTMMVIDVAAKHKCRPSVIHHIKYYPESRKVLNLS